METLTIKKGEPLPHACIAVSPSARERDEMGLDLAAALLCAGEGDRPCRACPQCRKVFAGVHPDLIHIGGGEGGARRDVIQVAAVRGMVSDAQVMPNEAARKVYLIHDADTMNIPAQNALLKLLEEPPAGAAFVLCTGNPALLLPTVRSRCAVFRKNAPDDGGGEGEAAARAFLEAAASGDAAQLVRWCFANEGMDPRAAAAFVRAARLLLGEVLCGTARVEGLDAGHAAALLRLFARCAEYLRQNTGVKHVFGLLCADGLMK